jgi:hypothetical protein
MLGAVHLCPHLGCSRQILPLDKPPPPPLESSRQQKTPPLGVEAPIRRLTLQTAMTVWTATLRFYHLSGWNQMAAALTTVSGVGAVLRTTAHATSWEAPFFVALRTWASAVEQVAVGRLGECRGRRFALGKGAAPTAPAGGRHTERLVACRSIRPIPQVSC